MAGLMSCREKIADENFPDTLLGFGYAFDKDGKMKNVKTGKGFQFVVREGDQAYNQLHYEALGEVVTEEVYRLLETECKLKRVPVPHDANDDEPSTFIFISEDAMTNPEKILVLIHGSGVVRAGQWARRLIINDSLESGTQIPFIKKAQEEGYGIVVMNTNDNYTSRISRGKNYRSRIREAENPEQHALHVWEHYIKVAKAKHVAIIAHSYGGCVTTALFQYQKEDFLRRVFAVAMTDSVHFLPNSGAFKDLIKISCNWVCSKQPLDTLVNTQHSWDIKRVSSGVTLHEMTSWASFHSVFKFLQQRLEAVKRGDGTGQDGAAGVRCATEWGQDGGAARPSDSGGRGVDRDGTYGDGRRRDHRPGRYGGHEMSDDEELEIDSKKKKMDM